MLLCSSLWGARKARDLGYKCESPPPPPCDADHRSRTLIRLLLESVADDHLTVIKRNFTAGLLAVTRHLQLLPFCGASGCTIRIKATETNSFTAPSADEHCLYRVRDLKRWQ